MKLKSRSFNHVRLYVARPNDIISHAPRTCRRNGWLQVVISSLHPAKGLRPAWCVRATVVRRRAWWAFGFVCVGGCATTSSSCVHDVMKHSFGHWTQSVIARCVKPTALVRRATTCMIFVLRLGCSKVCFVGVCCEGTIANMYILWSNLWSEVTHHDVAFCSFLVEYVCYWFLARRTWVSVFCL